MFRKAQLKLFAIISGTILAVFFGLLGAINIITEEVMNRQAENTLEQIAASLEYNDETRQFTLNRPDGYEPRKNDIWREEPPEKPTTEKPTEAETTSETTTEEVTTEAETEADTQPESEEDTEEEEEIQEEPQPPQEEPQNEPEQPAPPPADTQPPEHEQPPSDNNGGGDQQQPWNPWENNGEIPTWPNPWENNGGDQQQPDWSQYPWGLPPWMWGWQQAPNNGWGTYSDEPRKDHDDDDDDDKKHKKTAYDDLYEGGIVPLANTVSGTKASSPAASGTTAPAAKKGSATTFTLTTAAKTTGEKPTGTRPSPPPEERNDHRGNDNFDENGKRVEPIPKTLGSIDFFAVMADTDGSFKATLNNDDLSDETAQAYITAIMDKDVNTGTLNSFQFYRAAKSNGTLIVFTDKSKELDVLKQLKKTTVIIGLISIGVLAAAAYFLSKKSIEPIKTAFEKQKQFVSDASHELKTPLTVISTNADVLEGEIGENRWLSYIKSQTDRMSVLVNDLLNLTRLENNSSKFIVTEVDLSKAIENTALPFECQAFEQNKKFIIDVDKGITVSGSEQHLKQMAAIFIDNALKYSNDGGTVKVMLKKQGDKKIFSVYNTGQGVKEEDKYKIFERFYRSDESRNRSTGGYGLGLAIAKSIIDKHKFKINVLNQEGKSICFVVSM